MKIHACSFAIAGAATIGAIYAAFAVALKYFPNQMLNFIGTTHMLPKLEYIKPFIKVTPQSIAIGIISHTVIAFIVFWLIATIYNISQKITK